MTQGRRSGPPARRGSPPPQALAKIGELLPADPIQTIGALDQALQKIGTVANVITPMVRVEIPPMHQVSLRVVRIDPDSSGLDVYQDRRFCESNERALGKRAILKLMAAAGISKTGVRRVDDRSQPYFWEYEVAIQGLDYDGHPRQEVAVKEVDLRDGAPDTKKPAWRCNAHGLLECRQCPQGGGRWKKTGEVVSLEASALEEKRKHGAANAETKALLRALREWLNLPHKMTVQELGRPFVVPKVVPCLDLNDPDVKAAMIDKAVWGTRALYGPGTTPQEPARGAISAGQAYRVDDGIDREEADQGLEGDGSGQALPPVIEGTQVIAEPKVAEGTIQPEAGAGPPGPEPPPLGAPTSQDGAAQVVQPPPAPADEGPPPPLEEGDDPLGCGCPCDCPVSLTAAEAKKSKGRLGCLRCQACYPGPGFQFDRHPDELNLELPKYPHATPVLVRQWTEARRSSR